jgi:hypothetical protein
MKIFLSYATADRQKAEEIALALQARGHDVFFDREDLSGGEDYNTVIRREIAAADAFIFLASPASTRAGGYALTELRFARERWEHPVGHVLPVLLEPTPLDDVPAYLRSVTLLEPQGNVAAEIAGHIERARSRTVRRRILITGLALAVVAGATAVTLLGGRDRDSGFRSLVEEDAFVARYVYTGDAIERVEYNLDPGSRIVADSGDFVTLERVAWGAISDTAEAFKIDVVFTNLTAEPLQTNFHDRYFGLVDDQGRTAPMVQFCCASEPGDVLSPGQARTFRMIFTTPAAWSGKETQANQLRFQVNGLLPVVRGRWQFHTLATARAP